MISEGPAEGAGPSLHIYSQEVPMPPRPRENEITPEPMPELPHIEQLKITQSNGEVRIGYLYVGHVYYYGPEDRVPPGARRLYVEIVRPL
jgi:hypothetical protein